MLVRVQFGRNNPTWSGRKMSQAERDAAYAEEDRDRAEAEKHAEWVREQERKRLGRSNITDRAKRYRAQHNVTGPKRCVLCGSRSDLGVMHLDGNEANGEPKNLAWGCRSCNQVLSHAFKRIGAGVRTKQYNPSQGVPTFEQYAWAVSHHDKRTHAHDEGGAVIHATPKSKRIEYARRIADLKASRGTGGRSEVPF